MKFVVAVPAIAALVYRAWSRKSLTLVGILTAFLTAVVHALHPWSVFFTLLAVFFLTGTAVTKIKHDIKAKLTQSANGASGGEGPRNHIQVLANSVTASLLIVLHTVQLQKDGKYYEADFCQPRGSDLLVIGIVANYAAVTADTFSSELGILSKAEPRLVTAPWRAVAPGTNGGVTLVGLGAGALGAYIIASTSTLLLPFCKEWSTADQAKYTLAITIAGLSGSILDSYLGAILQASVVDVRSGKVVEGAGGRKVLIHASEQDKGSRGKTSALNVKGTVPPTASPASPNANGSHASRKIIVGNDILDNNGVNLLMAAVVSIGSMVVASFVWDVPARGITVFKI